MLEHTAQSRIMRGLAGVLLLVQIAVSQGGENPAQQPLPKATIIDALRVWARVSGRAEDQKVIADRVRTRGVDFYLTPEVEEELRAAGAGAKLLEIIRAKAPVKPPPGEEEKNQGIDAYRNQNFDKAVYQLSAAAKLKPSDAEVFYFLGASYVAKERYNEAIEAYRTAIKIDPGQATAAIYFNLGQAYELTNNFSNALAQYKKTVAIKDDYLLAWIHLGAVASKLSEMLLAIDAYEHVARLDPNINDANMYLNWGRAYASISQYEKSLPRFQKAIELNVGDLAAAYFGLGQACYYTRRYPEAAAAYQKQVERKNDDVPAAIAYSNLGEIYSRYVSDRAAAVEAYKNAVRINNTDNQSWFNLAIAQHNFSKHQDALESAKQAVSLAPTNADYLLFLAKEYRYTERYDAAMETIDKVVAMSPQLTEAHYYRGVILRDLKRFNEATESLNRALLIGFTDKKSEGKARYILAVIYRDLGNTEGVRSQCAVLNTMGNDKPKDDHGICK